MRRMIARWALPALAMLVAAGDAGADVTLDDILKPDQTTFSSLSPSGQYVAMGVRTSDKVIATILERETAKVVRVVDPGEEGAVEAILWVGDERVFIRTSNVGNAFNEPITSPRIIAINVDGSARRDFYASVVDPLPNDPDNILISVCVKSFSKGCMSAVHKVSNEGGKRGDRIADAPVINADFLADNRGNVRFATSVDNDRIQQLWVMRNEEWSLLNDEAESGVEIHPMGFSRDDGKAYLWSERASGPDVIETIDMASGQRTVVMSDPVLDPAYFVWSVDGQEPIGVAYGLEVPRARFWDDSHPDAVLLRQMEAQFPDDAIDFGEGSRDGKYVLVDVWSDRDPGSTYLFDRQARRLELLSRRKPWLDPVDMAVSKSFAFDASDGLRLHGYLTLPLRAQGTPPLVVMPHGGPYGVKDGWGYDSEVQLLAAHGYAVMRVNFRGSDGFGRAFERAGYRQWGRRMQEDLTEATRHVVAQGRVDPSRICIWGASYGGYAALMDAYRAPELYRCVIAASAVTDLNVMWRWGDIQRSFYGMSYLESVLGKDKKELYDFSPVKYAGQIRPEVMLAHGVRDDRVPFEHARLMQQAFDRAGKAYQGFFPRNETHGIYGEENRREYYGRVLSFLATHTASSPPP